LLTRFTALQFRNFFSGTYTMKYLSLVTVCLALGSPLFSQFTTPSGNLSTEGDGYAYYFGGYQNGHFQHCDGELPSGVQVLTKVSQRLDYRNHSTTSASGRSWSGVTLNLSDGDHATMSSTFSTNILSTPSQVFSGTVNFPNQVGNPTSKPAPWNPTFPFSGAYIHTGVIDLLLDWQFTGGVLANNAAWGATSRKLYYLDGDRFTNAITYGRNVYRYIGTTTGYCADSSRTSSNASAQASLQCGLYHTSYTRNPAYAGKAVLQIFGRDCAPNSVLIRGIGLGGTTPGTSLTPIFGCHNLMINLSQIVLYITQTTSANGGISPWLYLPIGDLKVLSKLGSVPIWSQGVFDDSKTKRPVLTAADRCTPNFNRKLEAAPKRKSVFTYNATNTTGSGPSNSFYFIPILKYN
jgi:hypothetical protein